MIPQLPPMKHVQTPPWNWTLDLWLTALLFSCFWIDFIRHIYREKTFTTVDSEKIWILGLWSQIHIFSESTVIHIFLMTEMGNSTVHTFFPNIFMLVKTIYEALNCFDMLLKTLSPYKVGRYEQIYLWPCLSIHIKVSKAVGQYCCLKRKLCIVQCQKAREGLNMESHCEQVYVQ